MSSQSQQVSIKTVNLNKSKVCRTPLPMFYLTLTPKLLAIARPTSRAKSAYILRLLHWQQHQMLEDNRIYWIAQSKVVIRWVPNRVAEVARRHEGPSPKVLTWKKILSPNTHYFVAILRFVAIYAVFGILIEKQCFFLSKIVFFCHNSFFLSKIVFFGENSALIHGKYCILY